MKHNKQAFATFCYFGGLLNLLMIHVFNVCGTTQIYKISLDIKNNHLLTSLSSVFTVNLFGLIISVAQLIGRPSSNVVGGRLLSRPFYPTTPFGIVRPFPRRLYS